jgi:hypothetical protein
MPPFSEAARIQFEIEWVRDRNRKKRIRVTYEKAQKIKVGFLTYADLDVNTCWIGHFECSYESTSRLHRKGSSRYQEQLYDN